MPIKWSDLVSLRPAPPHAMATAVGASLSMGVPVGVGVATGNSAYGLTASLGAFTALYGPTLAWRPRLLRLVPVALGLCASVAVGHSVAAHPWAGIAVVSAVAVVAVGVCLAVAIGPPGGYMFVLVCAVGTHMPPGHTGRTTALVAAGAATATLIATAVSRLAAARIRPPAEPGPSPKPVPATPPPPARTGLRAVFGRRFGHDSPVVPAALRAAAAAMLAGSVALLLGLDRPYWAAATAVAVAGPGLHVVATVQRGIHRAAGTCVGVLIAAVILLANPRGMGLVVTVMALQFAIENLVPRNYALGVSVITPLALLIAESVAAAPDRTRLLETRPAATLVGCAAGMALTLLARRRPDSPDAEATT